MFFGFLIFCDNKTDTLKRSSKTNVEGLCIDGNGSDDVNWKEKKRKERMLLRSKTDHDNILKTIFVASIPSLSDFQV